MSIVNWTVYMLYMVYGAICVVMWPSAWDCMCNTVADACSSVDDSCIYACD